MKSKLPTIPGLMAAVVAGLVFTAPVLEGLTLPAVLSDHMVLQRDRPVPVWGTSEPGAEIVVSFAGQQVAVRADEEGRWLAKLAAMPASAEPRTLTIRSGPVTVQSRAIVDVLVGEVWVGSGQSNMDLPVRYFATNDAPLAAAAALPHPLVRLLDKGDNGWKPSTPLGNSGFSALLFAFGLQLQEALGVPVGLLEGAVGGTPSGFWLSQAAYEAAGPACSNAIAAAGKTFDAAQHQRQADSLMAMWTQVAAKAEADGRRAPPKPKVPLRPGERRGKIGSLYEAHIRPFQPYAIRGVLWDQGENGTGVGGVDPVTMMGALIAGWRREWGQGDFPFLYVQKPNGGGCALNPADPTTRHAAAFAALPARVPENGESRELYIRIRQHPNTFMVTSSDLGSGIHPPGKTGYAARAVRVALCAVYGAKDVVNGPLYMSHAVEGAQVRIRFDSVGQGLALGPASTSPGTNAPAPAVKSRLQGFAVAGEDRVFHWADASIDGDTVVLSSHPVAAPVAVRYAWAQQHPWANLFNRDGLPAPAFRTDDWPGREP